MKNLNELNFRKPISPNICLMLIPLCSIVVLFVLFVFALNKAYQDVTLKYRELTQKENNISLLQAKVSLLEKIQKGLLDKANVTIQALPDTNPSLVMLSQLKKAAEENSLVITDLKFSNNSTSDLDIESMSIELSISGNSKSFLSLLKSIDTKTPISTIKEVNIVENKDANADMTFDIAIYWSQFPKSIPNITQPIIALTSTEEQQLEKLKLLKNAEIAVLERTNNPERENPFVQ